MNIKIVKVETRRDLREFIDLPWKIYKQSPNWVPPLKQSVKELLDSSRHPFWKFSDQILLLAKRGKETVGRIAGIIDRNHNNFHSEKAAAWGFFESINDIEVARTLFFAVEQWAVGKSMKLLRGPLNPSTNYEIGTLIEGFEYPPTVMMTYNPQYYVELIESCGFSKEKDLVAIQILPNDRADARVQRLAARIMRKGNITIRKADKSRFDAEMALIKKIYDTAWERNWGFVPMTDDEMVHTGRELVKIIDPDLVFFINYDEEPVGICVILPDINPLLKRLNGTIGLSGLLKIVRYKNEIKGLRGIIMGFKRSHQKLGLPLVAFNHINITARAKGYTSLELGWNLEDNHDINNFEIELGGRIYKRYRIYLKSL